MLKRVRTYIENNNLINQDATVVVGLSGGADSVALSHMLFSLGYKVIAAHCNFHLRGEESTRDELFVKEYCSRYNIVLEKIDFNTEEYCKQNKLSIEMGARELRYRWFNDIRLKYNAQAICIAHHIDDAIETFFLNLLRGTGINGICGIKAKNGFIVRPLLCLSRKEVEAYVREEGLDFVIDSTNKENHYMRNKIRNIIIPQLVEINPEFRKTMALNLSNFCEQANIYNDAIERLLLSPVTSKTKHRFLLTYEWLKKYGFTPEQARIISENLDCEVGKMFYSSTHILIKERTGFILREINSDDISPKLSYEEIPVCEIDCNPNVALLDADKIDKPLELRKWNDGDAFCPLGMNGFKKVSDFLTDIKIDSSKRRSVYVLLCGNDIVWVVGYRIDNRYKMTSSTSRVLKLKKDK